MISPILRHSLSFEGNSSQSARDAYKEKMARNEKTAQAQNMLVLNQKENISTQTNSQVQYNTNKISVQGTNKKLDVVA